MEQAISGAVEMDVKQWAWLKQQIELILRQGYVDSLCSAQKKWLKIWNDRGPQAEQLGMRIGEGLLNGPPENAAVTLITYTRLNNRQSALFLDDRPLT